jgi:hypothetical protein
MKQGGIMSMRLTRDIVIISGGKEKLRIPVTAFAEQAVKLLTKIKGSTGAFSVPKPKHS